MAAETVERVDGGAGQEAQLRRELAAVYRLLEHFGMSELTYTHASARLPGEGHNFLLNPYGLLFDEITASNLLAVDISGRVIGDSAFEINPTAVVFHSAIQAGRRDARCVIHSHTVAGCAVAAQRSGLLPLNQISMAFFNRIGYHDYRGIAYNTSERESLLADLGTNDALILRNHGLLTVGATPGQAFLRMFYLHKACQIQIAAQAGGPLSMPSARIAEHVARQWAGTASSDELAEDDTLGRAWNALLRMVDRVYPDYTS